MKWNVQISFIVEKFIFASVWLRLLYDPHPITFIVYHIHTWMDIKLLRIVHYQIVRYRINHNWFFDILYEYQKKNNLEKWRMRLLVTFEQICVADHAILINEAWKYFKILSNFCDILNYSWLAFTCYKMITKKVKFFFFVSIIYVEAVIGIIYANISSLFYKTQLDNDYDLDGWFDKINTDKRLRSCTVI